MRQKRGFGGGSGCKPVSGKIVSIMPHITEVVTFEEMIFWRTIPAQHTTRKMKEDRAGSGIVHCSKADPTIFC